MKWVKQLLVVFLVAFMACGTWVGKTYADTTVSWQTAVDTSYDTSQPGSSLVYKDELSQGGLDLSSNTFTTDKKSADVVFDPYGNIGASSLIDLGQVAFDSVTSIPDSGFTYETSVQAGHVYLVATHDGSYAKVLVKQMLASTINIEYALVDTTTPTPTPTPGGGGDVSQTLTLPQGSVSITWDKKDGDYNYTLLRSDNGGDYASVSDFKITDTSFTDQYAFAGHTYLYEVVAYDAQGNQLYTSQPIKVIVTAADTSQTTIVLQINNQVATVNGVEKTLDVAPTVVNYRTLVPFRFIGEALGAQVAWNGDERSVTLSLNGDVLKLFLNKSDAIFNGKSVTMDVPPQIINGRTMLPVHFVSDMLHQTLNFESATGTITITGPGAAPAPTPDPTPTPAPTPPADDLSAFFHTFSMIIPSSVDDSGTGHVGSTAGTLTVNSDGTYVWDSTWSGHLTGTWVKGDSEYPIVLQNGEDGHDWKLGTSTASLGGDIIIWDGSITQVGTKQ